MLTEEDIDTLAMQYLGLRKYNLLPDPLGDYIDHIDCWGKYLDVDKVLIGQVPPSDPRYDDYEYVANFFALQVSSWGTPFQVYRIYTPGTDPGTPYTNSLILNNKVFVPITGSQWDDEALAVYEEAIRAGAYVFVDQRMPGAEELFYKYASDDQLDFVSPIRKLIAETFEASLYIDADHNSRNLAGIDASRVARSRKAGAPLSTQLMKRSAEGTHRWCITVYPTHAMAQDADMSLVDYREFVYGAGMLDEADPVAFWKEEGRKQQQMSDWLKGRDRAVLKGENVDISLSIKDRRFEISDGRYNFPDGEIFTSPVEESVKGWIRFRYPAIYQGQEVTDSERR